MTIELGILLQIDLREVWTREDGDFTPWLAMPENIQLLGDTIGLDLELFAQEKNVGPYRADILCKETSSSEFVLIENQLEKTDHTHLGQLLTYAAGLRTATIVWIAKRFTEEHRAAIDWFNSITSDEFNFIGIEIEAWKIGESKIAPKFNIIAKPNNWTRGPSGIKSIFSKGLRSTSEELYLEYWTAFCSLLKDENSFLKLQKPQPQYWHVFAVGRTGFHISVSASVTERILKCNLVMEDNNAKQYFSLLQEDKKTIEKEFSNELEWREMPDKKSSHISFYIKADPNDRSSWQDQHNLLKSTVEKMHQIFSPRVRNLSLANQENES